jgi:phage regulator Rha-like protein
LHLFISYSLKSICDHSGEIAYRFDNFHKNIDFTIDRAYAELQNICNTLSKVSEVSEYSFGINIKSYSEEMTVNGIILNRGQQGIDDGSGYTPTEKGICFVS